MATDGDQELDQQPQLEPQPRPQGGPSGGGGFSVSGRMLGIVGGGAAVLAVVIIVVVLLTTGVFGGGGGVSGGSDVLAYVPADYAGIMIIDSKSISDGDVPEDYLEWLEEDAFDDVGDDERGETYKALGIDEDRVELVAVALGAASSRNYDDTLDISRGNFEYDVIREELEDGLDCEDDDYRGFELWDCPGKTPPAVALFEEEGYVVVAVERRDDLEDMLTLKSRTPEELANFEDSDPKRLLDRAGNGWLRFAFVSDECAIIVNRCEGIAFAIGEGDDSESMPVSYAVMFGSERAAMAAEDDVGVDDVVRALFAESFDLDLDIGEVKAEGDFVIGSGFAEFVDSDDASSRSSDGNGRSVSETEPEAVVTEVSLSAEPVGRTLGDPVEAGGRLTTEDGLEIVVIDVDRYSSPWEGRESYDVFLQISNTSSRSSIKLLDTDFTLIGDNRIGYESNRCLSDHQFTSSADIFPGGKVEGKLCFTVHLFERNFILAYEGGGEAYYFRLK